MKRSFFHRIRAGFGLLFDGLRYLIGKKDAIRCNGRDAPFNDVVCHQTRDSAGRLIKIFEYFADGSTREIVYASDGSFEETIARADQAVELTCFDRTGGVSFQGRADPLPKGAPLLRRLPLQVLGCPRVHRRPRR